MEKSSAYICCRKVEGLKGQRWANWLQKSFLCSWETYSLRSSLRSCISKRRIRGTNLSRHWMTVWGKLLLMLTLVREILKTVMEASITGISSTILAIVVQFFLQQWVVVVEGMREDTFSLGIDGNRPKEDMHWWENAWSSLLRASIRLFVRTIRSIPC